MLYKSLSQGKKSFLVIVWFKIVSVFIEQSFIGAYFRPSQLVHPDATDIRGKSVGKACRIVRQEWGEGGKDSDTVVVQGFYQSQAASEGRCIWLKFFHYLLIVGGDTDAHL